MLKKLNQQQLIDLQKIILQGKKIYAIKKYRAWTQCDLLTAKNYIDKLSDQSKNIELKQSSNKKIFSARQIQMMTELTQKGERDDAIAMYMRIKHKQTANKANFLEAREFIDGLPSVDLRKYDDNDTSTHDISEHISPLETKDPDFISSQWQLKTQAPFFIKNYIDERIPLMEKDKYVAIATPSYTSVIIAIIIAVLISNVVYNNYQELVLSNVPLFTMNVFIVAVFALVALVFFLFVFFRLKNIKKTKQLKQQNKYRQGMFVLRDAIILHRGKRYCYLPKEEIYKFNLSNDEKNPKLNIYLKSNNKHTNSYELNFLKVDNRSLKEALDNWQQSDIWHF